MPVRLHGRFWLGSRRTHKLELLLSKGEENSASSICLAAAMDKPGLATHQHEAKFGQGRAGTASWLARVHPACSQEWEAPEHRAPLPHRHSSGSVLHSGDYKSVIKSCLPCQNSQSVLQITHRDTIPVQERL